MQGADRQPYFDAAPQLPIALLKTAGALTGSGATTVRLLNSGVQARTRLTSPTMLEVEIEDRTLQVALHHVQLKHGLRPYFLCPQLGTRCTALCWIDGRLASRKAAGLTYATQSMSKAERVDHRTASTVAQLTGDKPARGPRRQALLSRLRREPPETLSLEALEALDCARERERLHRKRRRRPAKAESPMTTRRALLAGRQGPPRLTSSEVLNYLEDRVGHRFKTVSSLGLRRLTSPSASRADHPQLDIRSLRPRRGAARGHALVWRNADGSKVRALACLETDGGGREMLLVEIHAGGRAVRQRIIIVGGARYGDGFLICPVTRSRHVKLYYREGRFASQQAQKLR